MTDMRTVIFDVDGTLAGDKQPPNAVALAWMRRHLTGQPANQPSGQPIGQPANRPANQPAGQQLRMALASGKPLAYLAGFARAAGLFDLILIGENGAEVQTDAGFPPAQHFYQTLLPRQRNKLDALRHDLEHGLHAEFWSQPSQRMVSVFFRDAANGALVKAFLDDHLQTDDDLVVYEHIDCYEVCPCGITKGTALDLLAAHLGLGLDRMIAVGDSQNDAPMFAQAGTSIGITGSGDITFDCSVDYRVQTIEEAIALLDKLLGKLAAEGS